MIATCCSKTCHIDSDLPDEHWLVIRPLRCMENREVPWALVDWLFVGGSTGWKLGEGAEALIRQAQTHGKRVHVGRVNSATRFRHFRALGCDSADGTFLAFGPDTNAPKLRRWISAPTSHLLWAVTT